MTTFVRALVSRLLSEDSDGGIDGRLSRNRHFEVFADEQGRQAYRTYRHLRGLVRDIRAAGPQRVGLERTGEGLPVRLRIPLPGGTRTTYLSEEELDLLSRIDGLEGTERP